MLRRRTTIVSSALALCLTFGTIPVTAQESPKEEAAKLYKEGVEAYFAADYAVAITKFRNGFQLDPNAMFLYNLSLSFSKLGNLPEALEHARRADEMGGMPAEAENKNSSRVVAFTVAVQAQTAAETAAQVEEEPQVPTCEVNSDCGTGEVCNMRRGVCVEELPAQQASSGDPLFTGLGWAGVVSTGVGVGMLIGTAVVSLQLRPLQERQETGDQDPDLAEQVREQQTIGLILLFGGTTLAVAGATMIVLDLARPKGNDSEQSILSPVVAPDYAGFSWSLRF